MTGQYDAQDRGGDDAYERYLSGMDQSMRQKVALTAAHLLGEGTVADMGMGSGSGTVALASLYPRVQVLGVDVNPEMVERARQRYRLPNVAFRQGDIARPVFEHESLDGIFDSSVLHHVTSFSNYDHDAARTALEHQVEQLKVGGSLIVRDFVAPEAREVWLDLPTNDGDETLTPASCSSARLFERFAKEFRKLASDPGFHYREESSNAPGLAQGWRRFCVDLRMAAEFLLRKDYRNDWDTEILEEYTYFTQARFEREFAALGLRLLASFPIRNPWIVKHRFLGRCALFGKDAERLPFIATNHVIVGEKVASGEGVRFTAARKSPPQGFLIRHCFRLKESGALRDLVRRPGTTLDVVPWFWDAGALYIVARKSHPRPVLQAPRDAPALDGATEVGYITEPILAIQSDAPLALTAEATLKSVGIEPDGILALEEVATYYPSPGGLLEEVRALHVRIEPSYVDYQVDNRTGFSSGGRVRAMDARQVLRAAQVGALPDARLELNVYELLRRQAAAPGPWIGAGIELFDDDAQSEIKLEECPLPRRRAFVGADAEHAGFIELCCRSFSELDASGNVIHECPREYVAPKQLSLNTAACILLRRHRGQPLVGLDADDLAAAQSFSGSSALWVTPAWRLPRRVRTLAAAHAWLAGELRAAYGVEPCAFVELGGRYHPSAGVTPEVVYPYAVPVTLTATEGTRRLVWVRLAELVNQVDQLRDGHLRIGVLRASHALGVLPGSAEP